MSNRTPDWLLERFALGELPPERMEQVRRDLEAEPDGQARLAALQASNRDILAAYPPPQVADAVLRRATSAGSPANNNRAWFAVIPVIAMAAALALFANVEPVPPETSELGEEIIRTKGLDPQLVVQRKREGDPERLRDGDVARPGDVLQLQYVAGGDGYGVVVSVDGRGNPTVHHADGSRAAHLQSDGAVPLPAAFELDDAPRFERFFLVSGAEPFEVAPVISAAEALADRPDAATATLDLPGLHVTSFTVRKP